MSDEPARGFLLYNDPHLSSIRPGRRRDDYTQAILGKLAWLIDLANEQRLIPLCTGDLFDVPREPDDSLKTRVQRIMARSWTRRGIINPGNHDMEGAALADRDSLSVIASSGLVIVPTQSGPVAAYEVLNDPEDPAAGVMRVGVGATPYGQPIPKDVTGVFGADVDGVLWLTHHDLAFGGNYPGALPLAEIRGCSLAFNGHMHDDKGHAQVGETMWCNFGSLARTDVSALDHQPSVTSFIPAVGLTRHVAPHARTDVFNLVGRLIPAAQEPLPAVPAEEQAEDSRFVKLLLADEGARTDTGALIAEELQAMRDGGRASEAVLRYVEELRRDVMAP